KRPDNCGGVSWFVLLAVEKNEPRKRISITRTFFDRERKSFVSPYPTSPSRKKTAPFRKHKRIKRELKNKRK
ncbi:hypothetical protein, partial [Barnesiella intestinihominis]|uniref:hypothetical protein n=1 Tax=Barnesiella intestinihominis TaxID=487174 RepID=UPI003966C553